MRFLWSAVSGSLTTLAVALLATGTPPAQRFIGGCVLLVANYLGAYSLILSYHRKGEQA